MPDTACPSRFPDTFLDYIPNPSMGHEAYRQSLERSFESDEAGAPPIYALLKVTDRCNSQCEYCGHAGKMDKIEDASTELLQDVLDQLAEVGCVSVNFTGGEPMLRPDLPALVKYARARGLFPILLTNGLLLRKRSSELQHSGLGMIIVSVDSVRPDTYQSIRGVNLAPVLDGIEAILVYPEEDRPIITATTVVTSKNIDHLDEVVSWFSERGIGVKLTPYHHHGRWEDDHLSPRDLEKYQAAINGLKRLKESGCGVINSQAYLDNFPGFNFDRNIPTGFRCYSGYTTLYIDPALNVRSCWSAGLPVAGNLRKSRLKELLNGTKMRRMRQKIRMLKCEKCWLLCTAEISLRFQ
ncbi:MAG: radical SAM protein [Phycisphaerales bacterium]|nr:radical SAM protein [Phycisphaerales bacterium]